MDVQLEFSALLDRQIGWLFTLEDASDVNTSQPVGIEDFTAVARQPACCGERARLKFAKPCASAGEQGVGTDNEPARAQLRELSKDALEITLVAGIQNMKRDAEAASRGQCSRGLGLRKHRIGRIDEEAHNIGLWHELVQQLQPLRSDECIELRNTCDVLAWLVEVCDEAKLDRIKTGLEDDRNGRFRGPRCERCRCAGRSDHITSPLTPS